MNHVTFIVPTIGRDTLKRALESLVAQTNPNWNAIVISDGVPHFSLPINHPRILSLMFPLANKCWEFGGMMRNIGLGFDASEWFAFLDDDDRLDPHYVQWIVEEGRNSDLVVFRMRFPDGGVVPPPSHTSPDHLAHGLTGIAFAVRTSFQKAHNLQFIHERNEDWTFTERCRSLGARIVLSPRVGYFIRQ